MGTQVGEQTQARGPAPPPAREVAPAPPPRPSTPPPDTSELTLDNALGRRVLVASSMWPDYECQVNEGVGWFAHITQIDKRLKAACVRFQPTEADGTRWRPTWLALSALRGA